MTSIKQNLAQIHKRMSAAARRAGRDVDEITLVGVTKTHPAETVLAALAAGLQHIGENRVGELASKRQLVAEHLPASTPAPVWHMIGHIQSRKAAQAVAAADFIHSLDSLKLARRLERFAAQAGRVTPVLLEVNLSGEAAKYGWPAARWQTGAEQWGALREFVAAVAAMPHLRPGGLMTMAPWVMDQAIIRPVFCSARLLRDKLAAEFPAVDWRHLSMGMTDDFEIAIEEGATIIRVGRAIFGPRRPLLPTFPEKLAHSGGSYIFTDPKRVT